MEQKQNSQKATCIRDCYDGGAYDRRRLEESGIHFKEEKGELCKTYIHGTVYQVDPRNPIAVHFQFEKDPEIVHVGFHFDREKMQYIPDKAPLTQAQLDAILESVKAERRKNETLEAQLELEELRAENEKLRRELEAKKQKPEPVIESPTEEAAKTGTE